MTSHLPSDRPDLSAILGTPQQSEWGARLRALVVDDEATMLDYVRAGVVVSYRGNVPAYPRGEWTVVDPRTRCALTLTVVGDDGPHTDGLTEYRLAGGYDESTRRCVVTAYGVGEAMAAILDGAYLLSEFAGFPLYCAEWPASGCHGAWESASVSGP